MAPSTPSTPSADPAASGDLAARLAALESELAGLDAAIEAASLADDEAGVLRLLARQRVLPVRIRAALADLLRARIAEAEAGLPALDAAAAQAAEASRDAHEAYLAAERRLRELDRERGLANGRSFNARGHAEQHRATIARLRADLDRALNPPPPPTPLRPLGAVREVVLANPHADVPTGPRPEPRPTETVYIGNPHGAPRRPAPGGEADAAPLPA